MFPDVLMRSLVCQEMAYFSFQILAHWVVGSWTHRHQILAPKTLLRISWSSKPRPPWLMGLQILSQETRAHFFLVSSLPQRKSLWIFLNCCKIPLGAGRADKKKIGIDWRTTFVRINLPARFNDLKVHFLTLSCILLSTGSQILLCNGLAVRGILKYFEGRESLWKPRILEMFLWIAMLVFKKKNWFVEINFHTCS